MRYCFVPDQASLYHKNKFEIILVLLQKYIKNEFSDDIKT